MKIVAAPAPDALAALDWNRLMQGERRALDPEHQPIFDRLNAPAPDTELPPLPRLTGLLDEVFSATGLMEKAAFNDYVRSYARAAVEQIMRERDEALKANAALDKRMRELDEKLFNAEREAARWLQYVDPFDMYPDDKAAYEQITGAEK